MTPKKMKTMADDPILNETVPDRRTATRLSRTMGCEGAHKAPGAEDGGWHPCESPEALRTLIRKGARGYRAWKERQSKTKVKTVIVRNRDPRKLRKRRHIGKPKKWEKLNERGVAGIDTLPGGGLVSKR